jgi:hypothetical protein
MIKNQPLAAAVYMVEDKPGGKDIRNSGLENQANIV